MEGGVLLTPIPGGVAAGTAPPLPGAWAAILVLVIFSDTIAILVSLRRHVVPRLWAHYGFAAAAMRREMRQRFAGDKPKRTE